MEAIRKGGFFGYTSPRFCAPPPLKRAEYIRKDFSQKIIWIDVRMSLNPQSGYSPFEGG